MKFCIALAVVCLVASAWAADLQLNDEQKAKTKQYFEECIKQENVSAADAEKIRKKDFANPSNNIKCFGTCFFEKVGTLKDSKVQEDVVLSKLGSIIGEDKTKAILAKCKDVKGADRCDTGFKLYECVERAKAELMAA